MAEILNIEMTKYPLEGLKVEMRRRFLRVVPNYPNCVKKKKK